MSKQTARDLIDEKIVANGVQAITGPVLNNVLNTMVDELADQDEVSQLAQEVINLDRNISGKLVNIIDFTSVSPTTVVGLIPNTGSKKFSTSSATGYGVAYIPVSEGKVYHLTHASKTWFSVYIAAGFCTAVPAGGVVIEESIKTFASNTVTALDLLYCPSADGYLFVFYSTGMAYSFTQQTALKEFYTKTEVNDLIDNLVYREDRVALNIGLSDAKRIYDMQASTLSASVGSSISNNGKITITGNTSANYGINYLAVTKGKTYAFKAVNKTCLSGYLSVGFSEAPLTNNAYVDTRIYLYSTATESFDFLYTAIADGYIFLSYFSGETSIWTAKEVLQTVTYPVSDETLKLQSLIEKEDMPLSKIGWGRIGSSTYQGNLGSKYAMSEITPINQYKTLIAHLQGNNLISCICFFDADQQQILSLAVVGTNSLTTYIIDLTEAQYANVKYVQVGGFNNDSDFSAMYARLQPVYDLDTLRFVKYKKILCIGDSLTNSVQYTGQKRWVQYVQDFLSIGLRATTGTSGANLSNNGADSIYATIQASTTDPDVDLITLWGGTNDWGNNITLGDFETQIVDGTRDTTTFYGGLIANVLKLISLYPSKRIILIGTTPRTWNSGASDYNNTPNAGGKYLRDFVDAVKKVAEWFGLPFLDLLRTSGINANNIDQYMYSQTSGGATYYLHFSDNGELQIGYRVASFINSVG